MGAERKETFGKSNAKIMTKPDMKRGVAMKTSASKIFKP